MRYVAKRFAFALILSLASFAMIPVDTFAKGSSPLMPPQSNAFGNSFEQWNVLQTQWALALGLGDATELSDTVGRVRLLPGDFTSSTPVFNITLAPGTPFVASPFFVFGERYDDPNVPDDDPIALAAFIADVFSTAEIQVVLDGRCGGCAEHDLLAFEQPGHADLRPSPRLYAEGHSQRARLLGHRLRRRSEGDPDPAV